MGVGFVKTETTAINANGQNGLKNQGKKQCVIGRTKELTSRG